MSEEDNKIELIVAFPIYKPLRRIVQTFQKKMEKVMGKMNPWLRPKYRPVVEELNQFMYASIITEDPEYLVIENRKQMEDEIDELYDKISTKILKELQKVMKQDPELRSSIKAIEDINKEFKLGLDTELELIKKLPATVVEQIELLYKESSLILWDLPGDEIDRIIIGHDIINREGDSIEVLDIGVVADELVLAGFGKLHVPLLCEQVENIYKKIIELPEKLVEFHQNISNVESAEERQYLVEVASVFLGKLLGIREPILLSQKIMKRYLDLRDELEEEGKEIGSEFFVEFYDRIISVKEIHQTIDKTEIIMNGVSQNSEKIRKLYQKIELLEPSERDYKSVKSFVKFVSEIYYHLEDFRFVTETFQDVPSFTSMGGGVAIESDEKIDIDIPEDYAIYAENIFKTFPLLTSTVYALRGVDIKVKKGEFVAIMGPSGSGKTTLMNILSGLDTPDRGIVFVANKNLRNASESELTKFRRNTVAFIYQSYNLLPVLTNKENVALPADLGTDKDLGDHSKRAVKLLTDVGIERYKDGDPLRLSGGQQQRVTIARSFMNKPEILFCDEPTGDLDSSTGDVIMGLIEDFHKEGVTILLVTHDPKIAKRADRVIYMSDGQIVDKLTEA